jgi:hypothetical protein
VQHNPLEADNVPAISEVQLSYVVLVSRDVGRSTALCGRDTGACTDGYAPQLVGGLRVAFITAGDRDLEFLQNFNPAQDGHVQSPRSGLDNSLHRLARSGFTSRRLQTADINGTLAKLNERGFETIDLLGRPGSRRALIGFVQPKSLGHFVQREVLP